MVDAQPMQLIVQTMRDQHQHFVAGTMAELVVDLLEAVEVDEDQGTVVGQRSLMPAVDGLTIGKPRQRIGAGQRIEARFVVLLMTDVGMRAQQAQGIAVLIALDHPPAIGDPGDAAVAGQHAMHDLIDLGAPLKVIIEVGEHFVAVFRVQVLTPDIEMGVQLAGLIAQHAPPAIVEDGELAAGHFELPEAQAGTVERRRQFLFQPR